MAKIKRRRRAKQANPAPAEKRTALRRHPAVWLATLSTVVGIATGMFTLRDQVFPREAGTAAAIPVSLYQQRIGGICDELNDNDRARARADGTVEKQLRTAKTTIAQRNALLDGVRRSMVRSGHALAAFAALDTPTNLAATRDRTEAAWNRNLARLRDYALRLDRSATRRQLLAALDHLAALRPLLARDGITLTSNLERLGQANCDLRAPIVTATFTLPALPTHRNRRTDTDRKRPHINTPAPPGGSTTVGRSNAGGQTIPHTSTQAPAAAQAARRTQPHRPPQAAGRPAPTLPVLRVRRRRRRRGRGRGLAAAQLACASRDAVDQPTTIRKRRAVQRRCQRRHSEVSRDSSAATRSCNRHASHPTGMWSQWSARRTAPA